MLIVREAASWEITTPAKVNLFLEVLGRPDDGYHELETPTGANALRLMERGRRDDGYHELETVMLAVSLCDRLRFQVTDRSELRLNIVPQESDGFTKLSKEDFAWEIPNDETNLVIRALESVRRRFRIRKGMNIELIKGIPAQAGLGGGSSDAAAAILGGMLAWMGEVWFTDAVELASGLGSDINFFIEGRSADDGLGNWLARCTGRGECVTPIGSDWSLDLVIIQPPLGCSTKEVFEKLSESKSSGFRPASCDMLLQALERRDRSELARHVFNRLGDPASVVNPWIERLRDDLGAEPEVLGNCISGSGSALFAIVESADHAARVAERMRMRYPVRAFAVRSWQTPTLETVLAKCLK